MPAERFGKYTLLHQLAVGGMGEVWLARQSGPAGFDRFTAIKRLLPNLAESPEFVQMFQDEARLVARLAHPGICQVYEFDRIGNSYYLAMEYLHGESLSSMLERSIKENKPLSQPVVAYIAAQALEGLHFAHEAKDEQQRPLNLVHRDISPSNIFVTYDGQVKLLDFGIAKAARRTTHTQAGNIKGKFGYIAPEVYKGQPIDRRGDLFSMGVVLWEMLTRRRLYDRGADYEILRAIVEEAPRDPRELDTSVAPGLAQTALQALDKYPDNRFQTALEMRRSISVFLRALREEMDAQRMSAVMADLYGRTWIELRSSVLKSFREGSESVANADALNPTLTDARISELTHLAFGGPPIPRAIPFAESRTPAGPPVARRRSSSELPVQPVARPPRKVRRLGLWLGASTIAAILISVAAAATHRPHAVEGPAVEALAAALPQPEVGTAVPAMAEPIAAGSGIPPALATLVVTTNARDARVQLDDGEERAAPTTFANLQPASHHLLRVRAPGYEAQAQEPTLRAGSNSLHVEFAARRPSEHSLTHPASKVSAGRALNPDQPIDAWARH